MATSVYTGYWSGYYSNSKKPKPPTTILKNLLADKETKQIPDVDVAEFKRREERFKKAMRGEWIGD